MKIILVIAYCAPSAIYNRISIMCDRLWSRFCLCSMSLFLRAFSVLHICYSSEPICLQCQITSHIKYFFLNLHIVKSSQRSNKFSSLNISLPLVLTLVWMVLTPLTCLPAPPSATPSPLWVPINLRLPFS